MGRALDRARAVRLCAYCRSLPYEGWCMRETLSPRAGASLRSHQPCGFASLACTSPRTESPWNARSPALSRFRCVVAGEPESGIKRARPLHPRPSRTTTPAHEISRARIPKHPRYRVPEYLNTQTPNISRARIPKHPHTPHIVSRGCCPGGSRMTRARPRHPRRGRPGAHGDQARQVRRTRIPRTFRAGSGACEGRESTGPARAQRSTGPRTSRPSHAPDPVRQTPAVCPQARGPG